jgi:arylsulfatase/uncharacterized sulfatase
VYGENDAIGIEVSGNSALIVGQFKLMRNLPPFGDGAWHLFDIRSDPGETIDLGPAQPGLLRDMIDRYAAYESAMGVLPVPEGYSSGRQIGTNTVRRMLSNYAPELVLGILVLVGSVVLLVRRLFRRRSRQL